MSETERWPFYLSGSLSLVAFAALGVADAAIARPESGTSPRFSWVAPLAQPVRPRWLAAFVALGLEVAAAQPSGGIISVPAQRSAAW